MGEEAYTTYISTVEAKVTKDTAPIFFKCEILCVVDFGEEMILFIISFICHFNFKTA